MNLLLDTHSFLWVVGDAEKLSASVNDTIQDRRNSLYLSLVSIWEMQIKIQLGKLTLPDALPNVIREQQEVNALQLLRIDPEHIYALDALPQYHRDPFDRLLIAQALVDA